jgi:D-alanyl-D-alanine carboxypeptidase
MRATGTFRGQPYDIALSPIGGGKYLSVPAAYAFMAMQKAAAEAGITFKVNTAWRSFEHQTRLWDAYQAAIARGEKPSVVGRPGTSYHEIGEAVDIDTAGQGRSSAVYQWIKANGERFGFRDTVSSEPWHWQWIPGLQTFVAEDNGEAEATNIGVAVGGAALLLWLIFG